MSDQIKSLALVIVQVYRSCAVPVINISVMNASISIVYFHFFFLITFSISMYIVCVCLFSALSHRVGALQMFIIITINVMFYPLE